MKMFDFPAVTVTLLGGPHDGERIYMPVAPTLIVSSYMGRGKTRRCVYRLRGSLDAAVFDGEEVWSS